MQFKARLKLALADAGFPTTHKWGGQLQHWVDKRKDGTRRLKLADGNRIFNAPQEQQKKLEEALKRHFDGRYLGGYFIKQYGYLCKDSDFKNFCIVIDKE